MKSQWKLYQELELIPESVNQPKPHFFIHLLRPIRRFLARSFVTDLSHKHRILLFERCLGLEKSSPLIKKRLAHSQVAQSRGVVKSSSVPTSPRLDEAKSPQSFNRGVFSWWGWHSH